MSALAGSLRLAHGSGDFPAAAVVHDVSGLRSHVQGDQGERERGRETALLPHSDGWAGIEVNEKTLLLQECVWDCANYANDTLRYFSVETRAELLKLESAWHRAVCSTVSQLGVSTITICSSGRIPKANVEEMTPNANCTVSDVVSYRPTSSPSLFLRAASRAREKLTVLLWSSSYFFSSSPRRVRPSTSSTATCRQLSP